jgi:hypothetical protein
LDVTFYHNSGIASVIGFFLFHIFGGICQEKNSSAVETFLLFRNCLEEEKALKLKYFINVEKNTKDKLIFYRK